MATLSEPTGDQDAVEPAGSRADGRPEPPALARPGRLRRRARLDVAALLPAALVLFFSFQAGGFFPGSIGVAACALAVLLTLRVTLAERPFAGVGVVGTVCAAALAAFAAWTLVSTAWSDAPGRALLEFDRTLLYLLTFLLASTFTWDARRLAFAVRTTAGAIFAVCLVGWGAWMLRDLFALDLGAAPDRLSEPLTYWNAQGLLAGLGLLLAGHLACSRDEPRWVRALGAGATPVLASTLFFTFSRGAILATLVALAVYVVLTRSRGLLSGGLAVLPPVALAVVASYDADAFALGGGSEALRVEQGSEVAITVALCSMAALVLRVAADRWLDPPLHRAALPAGARRPVRILGAVAALIVVVAVPLTLGAPAYVERSFDRFVSGTTTPEVDHRDRLLNPGNNGRLDHWRVAVDTWRANPVVGTGAGTYATQWNQARKINLDVQDAHSLYVEVLSDLGIVGFVLVMTALVTMLAAAALRALRPAGPSGRDRSLDAVVVAIFVAWAVHAGLDWIWETPAVTAWVFALAGIALASRRTAAGPVGLRRPTRVAFGIGCLVLAVLPFQVARSQAGLDRSVEAFRASPQDCPAAIDASLASLGALGVRAEPWEIIAYCDVGEGQPRLALRAARNAVSRDPANWTYRYALALVEGVAGEDPRPAAQRALRLNPRNALAQQAADRFSAAPRRSWPRVARELELPTG